MPDIPELRLRTLESYVARLEEVRRDATTDGLGTLSYLVEIARNEAMLAVENAEREKQARNTDPAALWGSVP